MVKLCKGIRFIDLTLIIIHQEFSCVVTGEAKGHLSQIICTKGEKFGFFCNFVCQKCCSWNFDHRSNMINQIRIFFCLNLFSSFHNYVLDKFQLLFIANQRNHDLRNDLKALFFTYFNRRFDHRSCLHSCNFRIRNGQPPASVTHHRVELMQLTAGALYFLNRKIHILCQCFDILFVCRNKLMQRRIQETNRNRFPLHYFIKRLEIALLERNQLFQRLFALFHGFGKDHFTDLRNSLRFKEHVLCSAKSNPFCTKTYRICRICRRICIRANPQFTEGIRPAHDSAEVAADRSLLCLNIAVVNFTG